MVFDCAGRERPAFLFIFDTGFFVKSLYYKTASCKMETIVDPGTHSLIDRYGVPKYAGQRMSKVDFLRWESDDNYVYEFNNGILEPTISVKQEEMILIQRITRRFSQTSAYQEEAEIIAEIDVWVSDKQMRRPDLAYYTNEQIQIVRSKGQDHVIPSFVIEFVSENDDARKYIKKIQEYFQAGVQTIWLVFPDDYTVYVYTSPKTVLICTDNDTLSAAPALSELQITVMELFRQ